MPAPVVYIATHRPAVIIDEPVDFNQDDPLAPVRGLVHGIIGGVAFWGAILATVWLWWS